MRNRKDSNKLFVGEKSTLRIEISSVLVNTDMASKTIPPNDMNMPVGKRIARSVPTTPIGFEYSEPIAHEMELIIKKIMPTQLDSPSSIVGRTRMISPIKPATMPAELNLVGFLLKNTNMNIDTQIGIVELISAADPEDKY